MSEYVMIKNTAGEILSIRRDDGASIPACEGNMDYQRFLEETMGGVCPEEIMPDPVPMPSAEERLQAAEDMIAAIVEGAI